MVIREMTREECLQLLAGARLARLGCAKENQPYVVPVYLVYHEATSCLYGFTTPGQKVDWMRANPQVCVEVDKVAAHDQWVSVIVMGRYEEVPEIPGNDNERERAWQILKTHPAWEEPSSSAWTGRTNRDPAEQFISVYYRIRIVHVTGHEATREARDEHSYPMPVLPAEKRGWFHRTLTRLFAGRSKEGGSPS